MSFYIYETTVEKKGDVEMTEKLTNKNQPCSICGEVKFNYKQYGEYYCNNPAHSPIRRKKPYPMNETNAERLATTKNSVQHARKFIGDDGKLSFRYGEKVLDDFDWVIEQAERAQELEKEIDRYKEFSGRLQLRNDNLTEGLQDRDEEIARKNEALEFYSDEVTYQPVQAFIGLDADAEEIYPIDGDVGDIARQALEGVSNDETLKT